MNWNEKEIKPPAHSKVLVLRNDNEHEVMHYFPIDGQSEFRVFMFGKWNVRTKKVIKWTIIT